MIERRTTEHGNLPGTGTVVDARISLGLWLRAGRAERGLSLQDVSRITKIQVRILERLEAGTLDGLPADVFVRGFIRSFASCCGLDANEALKRYTAATQETRPSTTVVPPAARAMVEVMSDLAPQAAATVEPEIMAEASTAIETPKPTPSTPTKKKNRKGKRARRAAKRLATGTPAQPTPVVQAPSEPEPEPVVEVEVAAPIEPPPLTIDHLDPLVEPPADAIEDVIATETWTPKIPPATTIAPSVPWRRPAVAQTAAPLVPSLVIDDADPESAAQVLEDREAEKAVLTNAQRRSFLSPILLDREDRSARQGGLTLAVIILLIAATLTLSYLMRRPSSSGDGVTQSTHETQLVG